MILLPLRVVIQSRRSVHLFASHSLTLLTLWYKSMHKHVLYNDRRIVWICFAWQKQNESSTSFSNLGRYFHTCIHTYIRMYVGVRACICTLPKLSFVIWQVHCYELCILYVVALHWYKFMIEHAQSNTGFKQNRCWTNTQKRNKGNQWMDDDGGASSYRVTFKCKQQWYFFNLLGRQLTVRLKRT